MKKRKQKIWIYLSLFLFLGFTIFLTLNRHSKAEAFTYHSEIWADKAGYYVYLPAAFIYDFDGEKMPEEISEKTGNGFFIEDGKVITKYTYGVALMQSPFFLVAHQLSKNQDNETLGFGKAYNKSVNIAAVCYGFFALIFLYLFLIRYLTPTNAFITVACLYLGTNIFYYTIFETGMSHVYSLFLFSIYLYLSHFIVEGKQKKYDYLFGLIIGLIIVVRPINIIFLPVLLIIHPELIKIRIKDRLTSILRIAVPALIIIIPQLIYWKYAFGNYFQYSYGDESFSNLFSPKIFHLWFSPNNGLLIYNPIFIFIFLGLFYLYKKTPRKGLLIGGYLLFITYIFASWHAWEYGCSYGSRPYVEFYALFALPFGFFIEKIRQEKKYRTMVFIVIAIFILYNQKIMFSYDGCWYGTNWEWSELHYYVFGPTK